MKKLALFLFPILVFSQTAKFPASVVTDNQLTVATNRLTAQIAAPVTSSQTSITVASITSGPVPAYTLFTIDQGSSIETVMVCSASGTTLTIGYSSCPNVDGRGFDNTTAQAHSVGAVVNAYFVAWQQNAPNDEIKAIEGALGAGFTLANKAQKFTGSGPPGSIPLSLPGDIYADLTNDLTYQCFQPTLTACTTVAVGNWGQVGQGVTIYNVRNYGACGNNTCDDAPAVQAALVAAKATGGTVFFPYGTYKLNSFHHPTDTTGALVGLSDYSTNWIVNIECQGSTITTALTGSAGSMTMIEMDGGWSGSKVSGCAFTDTHGLTANWSAAIGVNGGGNQLATRNQIWGNTFANFSRMIYFYGVSGMEVGPGNTFLLANRDSGTTGFDPNVGIWALDQTPNGYSSDVSIHNNRYDGCTAGVAGTTSTACGDGLIFGMYRSLIAYGNTIERWSYEGIFVVLDNDQAGTAYETNAPISIYGNLLRGSTVSGDTTGGAQYGIRCDQQNCQIENNQIINAQEAILSYRADTIYGSIGNPVGSGLAVINNNIVPPTNTVIPTPFGIAFFGWTDVQILANKIRGTTMTVTDGGPYVAIYGSGLNGTTKYDDRVKISDNQEYIGTAPSGGWTGILTQWTATETITNNRFDNLTTCANFLNEGAMTPPRDILMADNKEGCTTAIAYTGSSSADVKHANIGNWSALPHTSPVIVVASSGSLPATCAAGELGFALASSAGQQIYECSAVNTWTQESGGGGGYTNLTQDGATGDLIFAKAIVGPAPSAPSFSASPSIDLSSCAGGACTMATMTANVTATFTNPKAGQHPDFIWTQPSTGGTYNYTVAYNSPVVAGSTCQLTFGLGVVTTQHFLVLPGGAIQGQGCVDSTLYSPPTAGTYGDSAHTGQFTLDTKGRITAAANVAISGGGGGSSFADFLSGSVTVANTGSDVTIYSAAMPALPAGACYDMSFFAQITSAVSTTYKIFVDSTQIATPFAGAADGNNVFSNISYCNQSGVQNTQSLRYSQMMYSVGHTNPPASLFFSGDGSTFLSPSNTDHVFSTPTGIDWSTGHTITFKTNAASGNTVGMYGQIFAH